MEDTILQSLLVTIIQVIVPVILTAVVVPLAKVGIDYLRSKVSEGNLAVAIELSRQLVLAAEQNGLKDDLMNLAVNKKSYVLDRLQAELALKGIHLDITLLSDLIEAQVHESFKLGFPAIGYEIDPVE